MNECEGPKQEELRKEVVSACQLCPEGIIHHYGQCVHLHGRVCVTVHSHSLWLKGH